MAKKEKDQNQTPLKPNPGVEAKLEGVDFKYLEKGYSLPAFVAEAIGKITPGILSNKFSMDVPVWDAKTGQMKFNLYTLDTAGNKDIRVKIGVGTGKGDIKHSLKFSTDHGKSWHVLVYQKTIKGEAEE